MKTNTFTSLNSLNTNMPANAGNINTMVAVNGINYISNGTTWVVDNGIESFSSTTAFIASLTVGVPAVGLVNGVLYTSANGVTGSAVGGSSTVSLATGNTLTAAQANASSIQSALTASGIINFTPGTYYVTGSPLNVPSLTTVDLTGCHLITYGTGSCYNMIQNANFNASPQTITSVAYTQPATSNPGNHRLQAVFTFNASVTQIVAGGYLEVIGDPTTFANGIWPVQSVSGNTVTVQMFNGGYLPANQSSVSWTAYAADCAIEIRNGIIDLNYSSGLITGSQTSYTEHGICFNHVKDLYLNRVEVRDCSLYAICTTHTQSPIFDVIVNNRLDGLKVYGPNFVHVTAKSISGTIGDDNSLQTCDGAPYNTRMPPNAGGSFWGGATLLVDRGQWSSYSGIWCLYPNGGVSSQQNYWMYGTYVCQSVGADNADYAVNEPGVTSSGFSIGNPGQAMTYPSGIDKVICREPNGFLNFDDANGTTKVGSITVDNWLCKSASMANTAAQFGLSCDLIVFNQPSLEPTAAVSLTSMLGFSPKSYNSVKSLVINNPHIAGNTNCIVNLLDPSSYAGGFQQIIINNPVINNTNGNGFIVNNSNTWGNTPNIIINNADFSTLTNSPITIGVGNADITLEGGKFNPAAAPFNFYGAGTITLTGGDNSESGTPILFANSSGTVKFKKWRRGALPTYYTPLTSTSVNLSVKTGDESCIINPASPLAALTLAFPSNANSLDGETRDVRISQPITVLSSSGGTVLGLPASAAAGFSRTFIYNATAAAWL